RLEAAASQRREHEIEPFMRREFGDGGGKVTRADALRALCQAHVDDDQDGAALAIGPAHLFIKKTLLVGNRVVLFPGHGGFFPRSVHQAPGDPGGPLRQWRATSSQLANQTPGSVFMRANRRSSMATRRARPETKGCRHTFK